MTSADDDQLQLWTPTAPTPATDTHPRCSYCIRPARQRRDGTYDRYCSGTGCSNHERICQACEQPFTRDTPGAGTRYCSTECKRIGYHPTATPALHCDWCNTPAPHRGRHRGGVWPYVCANCTEPIHHLLTRLKDHHVPPDKARRLITDPGCEICGVDIVIKRRDPITSKIRSLLVIDHDHDCCPGAHSCGNCVRGLICHGCNIALGMARNDVATLHAMVTYLTVYGSED